MTESIQVKGYDHAREIVERAKSENLVIGLDRIGAAPYVSFEPYTNHDGVVINHWMCVTYQHQIRPERTLLTMPTVVKPWKEDTWEVNLLSDPWVVRQVKMSRAIRLKEEQETIFERLGGYND